MSDPANLNSTILSHKPLHQDGLLSNYIPMNLASVLVGLCLLLFITRITSSLKQESILQDSNGSKTVPAVPYWFPLLGHLPNMGFDADGFVKGLRNRYSQGIFALNFGGTTHNVMYTPGLATALFNTKIDFADSEAVAVRILEYVFGCPTKEIPLYRKLHPELMECYKHLINEPSLGIMVSRTVQETKSNIQNLVSFAASPVDQTPWERKSDVKLSTDASGAEVVEASFLPLVRYFCAHAAVPSMMGSDFIAKFPDFFEDIWTLDRGFLLLSAGLPRWVPIPSVTRAHIARRKIIASVSEFHEAMEREANGQDPGADWRNLDDVGNLVKARMQVYRKYGFSIQARASIEHSLMWAGNANSNALVFWMLNRIYADPVLLARVRKEIIPYVHAVQPKQELSIPEPAHLSTFDVDGLCKHCPLLKSCYIECLRVDTASWSLKEVKQDFVLQARGEDRAWLLRKGEYAHAAHDLHNTDPAYFDNPLVWRAERHIRPDEVGGVDMGSIRPYGGGSSMCKGRFFAFKECMAFSAAIVALWDIVPAGGGEWRIPRHRKATGVYGTGDDTRVWVKRRKLEES